MIKNTVKQWVNYRKIKTPIKNISAKQIANKIAQYEYQTSDEKTKEKSKKKDDEIEINGFL